jgi:cellulose synthase/poly-beta-1,6-N-acetylglucosamine synthase-like glycosyltransferase
MLLPDLNILLDLGAIVLIFATLAFALQVASITLLRDRPFPTSPVRPSIAVLMPAHNEEQNIEATLSRIRRDLLPGDRLVVVADNCADQTALLTRRAGAEVVVRNDLTRRGKGFALAAGLDHLAARNPEIVVFVDADCEFNLHGLELLARACAAANAPVQCLYLMVSNPDSPTPRSRLAEFAWRIKNDLRPNGYARLGLPCHLQGTGMAMPWGLITPQLFATGHLTEDMFLGIELAIKGSPPRFFRESRVRSYFPATQHGQDQQKQRWIHGHLGLIKSHLPRLIFDGLRYRDPGLLALAADLSVPPLGMLAAAHMALLLLCLTHLTITGAVVPFALAAFGSTLFAFALITAWFYCGRDLIGLGEFKHLAWHLITVMRSALNLARGHRAQWIRADRSTIQRDPRRW